MLTHLSISQAVGWTVGAPISPMPLSFQDTSYDDGDDKDDGKEKKGYIKKNITWE